MFRIAVTVLSLLFILNGRTGVAAERMSQADTDWDAIQVASSLCDYYESREACIKANVVDAMRVQEGRELRLLDLNQAFYRKYPHDKRRWMAAIAYITSNAGFYVVKPSGVLAHEAQMSLTADEMIRMYRQPVPVWNQFLGKFSVDKRTQRKWLERRAQLLRDALASKDLSPQEKEDFAFTYLASDADEVGKTVKEDATPDLRRAWAPIRQRFEAHSKQYALMPVEKDRAFSLMGRFSDLARYLAKFGFISAVEADALIEESWRQLLDAPSAFVRQAAASRLEDLAAMQWRGYDVVKFAAMDGRAVDVSTLRGKLVLIDFWASWCPHCHEDMRHLAAIYRKYHAQGFEIVGINCDPESDRAAVTGVLAGAGVTWPQQFDGKGWGTKFRQLFGITALPSSFLIDRDGRLVGKDLREEHLEKVVREQLQRTPDLVAPGSVWRYWDRDSDPGDNWRAVDFDDSAWAQGAAELGYGDGDERTVLRYGSDPANKYPTAYFRREFSLTDISGWQNSPGGLAIRANCDDGCIVYVNGREVARFAMPAGNVSYRTMAVDVQSSATMGETLFWRGTFNASLLRPGRNVVAVEVHQVRASSSDLSFDLQIFQAHQ